MTSVGDVTPTPVRLERTMTRVLVVFFRVTSPQRQRRHCPLREKSVNVAKEVRSSTMRVATLGVGSRRWRLGKGAAFS
ncbi:MAG: hypothetical protein ACYDB2_06080 [Acidimicrobiales bacterium]